MKRDRTVAGYGWLIEENRIDRVNACDDTQTMAQPERHDLRKCGRGLYIILSGGLKQSIYAQLYICTNDTKSDDPSYDTAEAELSASLSTPPRSAPAYKFAASAPQLRQRRRCVAHNTI